MPSELDFRERHFDAQRRKPNDFTGPSKDVRIKREPGCAAHPNPGFGLVPCRDEVRSPHERRAFSNIAVRITDRRRAAICGTAALSPHIAGGRAHSASLRKLTPVFAGYGRA